MTGESERPTCGAFNVTVKLDGSWAFRCEYCGEARAGKGSPPPCPARLGDVVVLPGDKD